MDISFDSAKIENAANGEENGTYSKMKQIIKQRLGKKTQCEYRDIVSVIDALRAANSCSDLPHSLHPHPLDGNYKGYFAVDIKMKGNSGRGKIRLIFKPNPESNDIGFRIDNYQTIKKIKVIELCVDYH
jgi:mRNA-degrading endonuclease YafQ of YafQ-DinJ toxin-antitoxin module